MSLNFDNIPLNYIVIAIGVIVLVIFLLVASSVMKRKDKIDVSKMPKKVGRKIKKNKNQNANNINPTVESIDDLNITEGIVDTLNEPIQNSNDAESLAMVDTFKTTKTPIDKNQQTLPQFSFDNPNNNAAVEQNSNQNNENNNLP